VLIRPMFRNGRTTGLGLFGIPVSTGVVRAAPPPPVAPGPPAGADVASQLSTLADLKAQGHLTDAEFAAAKAKVLRG
jgi:putative oligomerization/nucleic acid binding protein